MASSDLIVAESSYDLQKKEKMARVKVLEDAINNLVRGDVLPEQITVWKQQLEDKVGGAIDFGI